MTAGAADPGDRAGDPADAISRLLEEYLALSSAGEAPSPETFAASHPVHHDQLLDALRGLARVQGLFSEMPQRGEQLGRFLITGVIGSGSMGTVYRARDETLQREVALKVFHPGVKQETGRIQRALAEARALARVNHPHVVRIYDVGEHGRHYYLCLELCEGTSLLERIRATGPLSVAAAVSLGRQLASGLAAVHACGLLHRDVKPGNILVDERGDAKLLDFSVAASTEDPGLSQHDRPAGTPSYMAPERVAGRDGDERADIFSLGLVLHEALSGTHPLRRTSAGEFLRPALRDAPAPLPGDLPRDVAAIVSRALAEDPEQRFPSAAALEASLARVERRRERQTWTRVALGCGVVLVVAVVLGLSLRQPPGRSTGSPAAMAPDSKLTASDAYAGQEFARAVAVHDSVVAVGAPLDAERAGAVYVFRREAGRGRWVEEAKLTARDGGPPDSFGSRLSLEDDVLAVGAHWASGREPESGAVYIYVRAGSTWEESVRLTAGDGQTGDSFGARVALWRDLLVVGAHCDDDRGPNSGAVFVFRRSGDRWTEESKLTASDGRADDVFGFAIAATAGRILVGAPREWNTASGTGKAYVFERDGSRWVERQILVPSDGALGDEFGAALAMSEDQIVVGSRRDDHKGSAYVYARHGGAWREVQKLPAPAGANLSWFGAAVAADGEALVIGAPFDGSTAGAGTGKAYLFRPGASGEWVLRGCIHPRACDGRAKFAHSLDLDRDTIVIGSGWDSQLGERAGAAYVLQQSAEREPGS